VEDFTIDQFVPETKPKTFDVTFLPWAAGLDLSSFCATIAANFAKLPELLRGTVETSETRMRSE